jgi:CPA1 family monovalent cation:H+ antiporter
MNVFHTIGVLLTLAALSGYLNYKLLKLPQTIGLMVIALSVSLVLVALGMLGVATIREVGDFVSAINFSDVLLHGMLAFLLFAGALHVDLAALRSAIVPIVVLATVGLLIATGLIGSLFWIGSEWLGFDIPFLYALLFGALIAPTDPIAVMGIIRKVGVPQSLEIKIAGESLFNDGVAVVVFLTILSIATGETVPDVAGLSLFFVKEAVGGIALGVGMGWITYQLMRTVDAYQVEVLMTLALASGGYALAEIIHVSAPIAVVAAGLLIGNHGRDFAMSEKTREHLDTFWELVDEILNAILFMIIGIEIVVLSLNVSHLIAGMCGILAVLLGRFISVSVPVSLMRLKRQFSAGVVRILTWGGLRGGISIALALSLPQALERELIVTVTYIVVIFSVLVQGLTIERVIRAVARKGKSS